MRGFGALELLTTVIMMSLGTATHSGIYPGNTRSHILTVQTLQAGTSHVHSGLTPQEEPTLLCFTNEWSLFTEFCCYRHALLVT